MTKLSIVFVAAAALLSACSISTSSKSSSDSSGSLSNSASSPSSLSSSGKKGKQEGYQKDVRDYTAEFVRSADGKLENFHVRIGKLAETYGLAQWQEDRSTYVAIGQGLRKAELSPAQYEAFKTSLGESVGWKMDAIAEGFGKP